MAKDDAGLPYNEIRYKKRAVEDEAWIRAFLHRASFGVVATAHEGQPFITPLLFAYDEAAHAIYLHGPRAGRLWANVEADGRACFNASEMGRLLPADTAFDFSNEYASVTVFGRLVVVGDEGEQRHGLQMLLDKYAPHLRPGRDYRPMTDEEVARTAVYRLQIEQWSGKKKKEAADFPGAYTYDNPPAD